MFVITSFIYAQTVTSNISQIARDPSDIRERGEVQNIDLTLY